MGSPEGRWAAWPGYTHASRTVLCPGRQVRKVLQQIALGAADDLHGSRAPARTPEADADAMIAHPRLRRPGPFNATAGWSSRRPDRGPVTSRRASLVSPG